MKLYLLRLFNNKTDSCKIEINKFHSKIDKDTETLNITKYGSKVSFLYNPVFPIAIHQ